MILPGLRGQNPHVMVRSCGHECAAGCWHDPFVFWVYGDGLMSLGHHLHTGILPFCDSEYRTWLRSLVLVILPGLRGQN